MAQLIEYYVVISIVAFFALQSKSMDSTLPVLPSDESILAHRKNFQSNTVCNFSAHIPCVLWMTTKNVSDLQPTYSWIPSFVERNSDWSVRIVDDAEMNSFMDSVFNGTQLLWAFRVLNPELPPLKTDIWRYAVLYVFGGGYMDTDSNVYTPLNKVIQPDDRFLFGFEGRKPTNCYHAHIQLANLSANSKLPNRDYVQWLFFSEPGHPYLKRIMENIVKVVSLEYSRRSILVPVHLPDKIICMTGPGVFTHSIMEVDSELNGNSSFRACGRHFNKYQAHFKMLKNRDIPNHYSSITFSKRSKSTMLLASYAS